MGRKEKMKKTEGAAIAHQEENKDLNLEIVQKELIMRAPDPGNDAVLDQQRETPLSEAMEAYNDWRKSRRKMRRRKNNKLESGVQIVAFNTRRAVLVQEEAVDTIKVSEKMEPSEAGTVVQMGDNAVLRKLLRGPRYFDPPADSGWGTCCNCGEEGHAAVNCVEKFTTAKRNKPCFLCGSMIHQAKRCRKARDCFICRKTGHYVKNCPRLHVGGSICLKCGISGHDMFSCKNEYSLDDLKETQCYICKRFGHLCCANTTGSTATEFSCYKCGRTGHTGLTCSGLQIEKAKALARTSSDKCSEEGHAAHKCLSSVKACSGLQTETIGAATPSSSYKCIEEKHVAQECLSSVKACSRLQTETSNSGIPSSSFKVNGEVPFVRESSSPVKVSKRKRELSNPKPSTFKNDYTGDKSAPHDIGMPYKKKLPMTEERAITTQQQSKHRGGWMVEHHDEVSPLKSKRNSWKSPLTPSMKVAKVHSFSSEQVSKRKRELSNTKTSTFQKENDNRGEKAYGKRKSHYNATEIRA